MDLLSQIIPGASRSAKLFSVILTLFSSTPWSLAAAFDETHPPLSGPYQLLQHPSPEDPTLDVTSDALGLKGRPVRTSFHEAYQNQSSVRAQGGRGTCSIFSTTAWIESWLIRKKTMGSEIDLSEEWLAHVVARTLKQDGSESDFNFEMISEWGLPSESTLKYIKTDWQDKDWSNKPRAAARCGHLRGRLPRKVCLIGHWDPGLLDLSGRELRGKSRLLLRARNEAEDFKSQFGGELQGPRIIQSVREVKSLLASGSPVVLDQEFFYGAWNHGTAEDLRIGVDPKAWARGDIGYPEPHSLDRLKSPKKPTGHSILIVGYDDEAEIQTTVRMENGKMKTFIYRGVYYFKNSWGSASFGKEFEADGIRAPGYGRITQRYAHEFGSFLSLDQARK